MSLTACDNCRTLVDTDEDDEFYNNDGQGQCWRCREENNEKPAG